MADVQSIMVALEIFKVKDHNRFLSEGLPYELLPNREACWVSTVHSTRQLALACHFAVQLCSPPRSICLEFGQNRTLLASKYKNEKEIEGR